MKRKSTPNQTYLNKTLIPKCQLLFKQNGINGIRFAKYLEYTYAIIRHNTEAEEEELLKIIKDNLSDLRSYIEQNYPNSRSLLSGATLVEKGSPEEEEYVQAFFIYKGLNYKSEADRYKWHKLFMQLARYCINKNIGIDDAAKTYSIMEAEEIASVLSLCEKEEQKTSTGPKKAAKTKVDSSWINNALSEARTALALEKKQFGAWNGTLLKLVWHCHKNQLDVKDFISKIPEEQRNIDAINAILPQKTKVSAK